MEITVLINDYFTEEEIQWTIADVIAGMLFGSEQERC